MFKEPEMLIECASPLKFNARPWKLGDHASLLDSKDDRQAILPRRMAELASLPDGVVDPGPYPFKAGGPVDWGLVTHSDLVVANIQIRIKTDPIIQIRPNCGSCKKLQDYQGIDLRELEVYPMSPEGIKAIKEGGTVPLSVVDADGKNATLMLKPLLCKELGMIAKLQDKEPGRMLEVQTCMQILEVQRASGKNPAELPDIRAWWQDQPWTTRDAVEDRIDELWGGVDTTYLFTCDSISCQQEQEGVIPLDLTFFGLVSPSRRQRRRRRSSGSR